MWTLSRSRAIRRRSLRIRFKLSLSETQFTHFRSQFSFFSLWPLENDKQNINIPTNRDTQNETHSWLQQHSKGYPMRIYNTNSDACKLVRERSYEKKKQHARQCHPKLQGGFARLGRWKI